MTETTETASFGALTPAHLEGSVTLCRAEGWPHRPEDWALTLGLSRGIAALDGDRLIGTAMATPFGTAGTLSMIIVARDAANARHLLAFLFAGRPAPSSASTRPRRAGWATGSQFQSFTLAAQALG